MSEENNNKEPKYDFWAEKIASSNNNDMSENKQQNNSNFEQNENQDNNIYRLKKDDIKEDTNDLINNNTNDIKNRYNDNYFNNNTNTTNNNFTYFNNNTNSNIDDNKSNKKPNKFISNLCKIAVVAVVIGLIGSAGYTGYRFLSNRSNIIESALEDINRDKNLENTSTLTLGKTKIEAPKTIQCDVSEIVDNTMPSIVSITSTVTETYNFWGETYNQDAEGSGSGIIVKQTDNELLIVTNNHVVEGANKLIVKFIDKQEVEATIKGTDSAADLAVISVDINDVKKSTKKQIKIAQLGSSDDIKVGQMSIAIGNALGYGQSVTVGYISAKDREVATDNNNSKMVLLQTDAAINPGNSGGALLNINGEVIGINSAKYSATAVEGMGYAIPISRATPIINELMEREDLKEEEQGYLGIIGIDVTSDVSTGYNMPLGVFVSSIEENSAAEEAGIYQNDIITAINDIEVTSISALREKIRSYRIGTKIKLTIQRYEAGKYVEKNIKATLKEIPKENLTSKDDNTNQEQQDSQSQQQRDNEDYSDSIEEFFRQFGIR